MVLDGEEELEGIPQDFAVHFGRRRCDKESAERCDAYGDWRSDDLPE